jgi:hypothetical protein
MPHVYDSRGIKPTKPGSFIMVPKGRYMLKIDTCDEGFSTQGDYKVVVDFEVLKPEQYAGAKIRFHNVTFIAAGKPGAGIAVHFLKSIGEPWEEREKLDIDPQRWVGKMLWADVDVDEYTDKNGKPRKKNILITIDPMTDEDVPF